MYTVDEKIICAPKIQKKIDAIPKCLIVQYCDSSIGLFSIVPHLVIAHLTLR